MKRRVFLVLCVLLLLLVTAAGGLFLARPTIIDQQRRAAEEELITLIENGQTQIEGFSAPEMEGEEEEFFTLEGEGVEQEFSVPETAGGEYASELEESGGQIQDTQETPLTTLIGYGVISIPAIELKMALVQGADSYALRASAGWLPSSAEMGAAGNCVILGHRMRTYGRQFNRLNELVQGDSVILYNASGDSFTYTVTGSEVIDPADLMDTLAEHNEGFSLTLVTCTPIAVCTQRLLVYAELNA